MLKQEFEGLVLYPQHFNVISDEFFSLIHEDYMTTNESKRVYTLRVFGSHLLTASQAVDAFNAFISRRERMRQIEKELERLRREYDILSSLPH